MIHGDFDSANSTAVSAIPTLWLHPECFLDPSRGLQSRRWIHRHLCGQRRVAANGVAPGLAGPLENAFIHAILDVFPTDRVDRLEDGACEGRPRVHEFWGGAISSSGPIWNRSCISAFENSSMVSVKERGIQEDVKDLG